MVNLLQEMSEGIYPNFMLKWKKIDFFYINWNRHISRYFIDLKYFKRPEIISK